jgi:hypothetical protein
MTAADDTEPEEEQFLALLAHCDESLALGGDPDVLETVALEDQARLQEKLALIKVVRQVLGGPSLARPGLSPGAEGLGLRLEAACPGPDATKLSSTEMPPHLGRFQIQCELGRGGMGIVYRAYDSKRDQLVALKSLPWLEPTALYRFKREFRRLADVSHPNLATLYELFAEGRQWFFTMELVEGVDFLTWVREEDGETRRQGDEETGTRKPIDLRRLRRALRQLAQGVAALHGAGILHRDIKPHNVLVTRAGRVVLLDFGLAADLSPTVLEPGKEPHALGTIPYLSPEQGAGLPLGPASDWYSVGVMLYVVLTGRLPFRGSALQILREKAEWEPPAPRELRSGVPEDLDQLCIDLLRRDPQQRPPGQEVFRCLECESASLGSDSVNLSPERTMPIGLTPESPLMGRESHLAALAEAFRVVKEGRPQCLYLRGPSGVGKTALVQTFLNSLREQTDAVILTGQCFEQESVPYKALDGLVDALSGYLVRLEPLDVQALLPADLSPLATMFPVLRRVEAINRYRGPTAGERGGERDPQEVRRRAFAGFRELLTKIGRRQPLILFVDDLQWGDLDSALLLRNLLQPPDPPALLLLGSYRSEETETGAFLRELFSRGRNADPVLEVRELDVGALDHEEARDLALRLLGDPTATDLADTIARESDGYPFFVHALAHHVMAGPPTAIASPEARRGKVDDVLFDKTFGDRLAGLPEEVRRLLGIVAVAGRPLAEQDAFRAAGLAANQLTALTALRSQRFIRAVSGTEEPRITAYHDRIRESVLSLLPPAVVQEHHRCLAHSLELSGRAEAELLAVHFHGADELEQAGTYYARAAERAAQTLAFDQAARLYRLALQLRPVHGSEQHLLRERLGDALANAGRGGEAAPEFLVAAEGSSPLSALQFRQRAALQYLVSGRVEEGLAVLGQVLAAVGLWLPSTPRQALLILLLRRARLWLRGLRFRQRAADRIAALELTRIDICHAAAAGVGAFDNILAAGFQSLELLLALRAGEPARLTRALLGEALLLAIIGGRTGRRAAQLVAFAEQIHPPGDDPRLSGTLTLARAMAAGMHGQWRRATESFAVAEQVFRERCIDVRWGINLAQALGLWNLYMQGEVAELGRRLPPAIEEAKGRGDLYALAYMLSLLKPYAQLCADQPDDNRRNLDTLQDGGIRPLSNPHLMLLCAYVQLDLYAGDMASIFRHVDDLWRALRRSLHVRIQFWRIITGDMRARAALAAATSAANPLFHLRAAERDARLLERERVPWGDALARLIRAGIAAARGDQPRAARLLQDAVDRLESAEMRLHAAVARRRLGELLGGAHGRDLIAQADAWMKAQSVVNPAAVTRMYAPGFRNAVSAT